MQSQHIQIHCYSKQITPSFDVPLRAEINMKVPMPTALTTLIITDRALQVGWS